MNSSRNGLLTEQLSSDAYKRVLTKFVEAQVGSTQDIGRIR